MYVAKILKSGFQKVWKKLLSTNENNLAGWESIVTGVKMFCHLLKFLNKDKVHIVLSYE